MGFVKIFDAILDSSISEEDLHVRWMWIAFLVSCDRYGMVYGTTAALARRANLTVKQAEDAITILTSSDPISTSPDEGGARVISVSNNTWKVVNYQKYRDLKDPVEERQKAAERKRRQRERERLSAQTSIFDEGEEDGHACHTDVTESHDIAEAEAEAEADTEMTTSSSSSGDDSAFVKSVLEFWNQNDLKPSARGLSKQRRSTIIARRREHGDDAIREALEKRRDSNFLCNVMYDGRGAPIDWLFGPKNFVKVLDGNYDAKNRGKKNVRDHSAYDGKL